MNPNPTPTKEAVAPAEPKVLTDQDKADLVAFMKEGLTGELPQVEEGRLLPDAEAAKEQADEELKEEKAEAAAAG